MEFIEGGLEGGLPALDLAFGAAKGVGGGRMAGEAPEGGAQAVEGAVFQEPFLGDGAVEEGAERSGLGVQIAPDLREARGDVSTQWDGGMARPVAGEEEIAGHVEEDAAPAAPRRGEGGAGGAGGAEGGVGVGVGVDGAVEADALHGIGIEGGDRHPPQAVGQEIAGGDAGGAALGEVEMGEEVHGREHL